MLRSQGGARQKMRPLQESYLFLFKILDGRINVGRVLTDKWQRRNGFPGTVADF